MEPLHPDDPAFDARAQRGHDRRRLLRTLNLSLAFVLLLVLVYSAQSGFDWRPLAVSPHKLAGLAGLLFAPLLHGSVGHVAANAVALLILGTLAGSVYPKATLRALPLLWLGSGMGAWLLGATGSYHLGASGVTHGLMFLVFGLGLLRRDRSAIAAGMIAFFFYGSMLLTVLPHAPGISWQSHLGGALAGLLSAWWFRRSDPPLPRKKYSWEEEEDAALYAPDDELEPPPPGEVPVLWQRGDRMQDDRGVVLRFPSRGPRDPGT
ncbi:rhomboid family intramembrane serine protease [Pseudoxanthomonas kalamensis DSM 18571]|uniref:rhomboid family intramembrane serine protease n=1 Tax=Pseudoxanthomonas kalamensis TaxID=289483 RepID=UPI001390B010|nr:rhomboid family intramembrane serine protease [Pseudoxanthomonas kalamensis]KAF1712312.1 rhomboid family intramembrane serine protease [Pseudoxanthomonas kalamensis DSM 18571]